MRRASRPTHPTRQLRSTPSTALLTSPTRSRSSTGRGRAALLLLVLGLGLSFWSTATVTALASGQTAQGGQTTAAAQGGFELRISVANCQIVPPLPPTLNEAGCAPAVGAVVSVVDDTGAEIGGCAANDVVPSGQAATCTVITPFDIDGLVYLDPSTIAAGFAPQMNPMNFNSPPPGPPDGIVSAPIFVNLPTGGGEGEVAIEQEPVQETEQIDPIQPQTGPADRLASVSSGTCGDIGAPAADPIAVYAPQGDPIGLPTALIAETGGGVIPVALDDLFASPHAILIVTPGDGQGTDVACGDLGSVADDDGVAVIGLAPVGGSGLAGIAYLSTDPANPAQTLVSIFLSEGLGG